MEILTQAEIKRQRAKYLRLSKPARLREFDRFLEDYWEEFRSRDMLELVEIMCFGKKSSVLGGNGSVLTLKHKPKVKRRHQRRDVSK